MSCSFVHLLQWIDALVALWPECKIVHGKPRHSQSQGSIERAHLDIERKLIAWMNDNNMEDWSKGLPFVQYAKNRSAHSTIF